MFTIFLRKLSTKHFRSHFKHVFRAIAMSCAQKHFHQNVAELTASLALELPIPQLECEGAINDISIRAQDLLDGVSQMLFATTKGIKNCLHSKGAEFLAEPLSLLLPFSTRTSEEVLTLALQSNKSKKKTKGGEGSQVSLIAIPNLADVTQKEIMRFTVMDIFSVYCGGRIVSETIGNLFRHCHPKNMTDLWILLLNHLDQSKKIFQSFLFLSEPSLELSTAVEISLSFTVEIIIFALGHSNHRALSNKMLMSSLKERIIHSVYDFLKHFLQYEASQGLGSTHNNPVFSFRLAARIRTLCTSLWSAFESESLFTIHQTEFINTILGNSLVLDQKDKDQLGSLVSAGVKSVLRELFPQLSRSLVQNHLLKPVLNALISLNSLGPRESWVGLFYEVLIFICDNREKVSETSSEAALESHGNNESMFLCCRKELQTLLDSCFILLHVDVDSVDTLQATLTQKNTTVFACRCLSWALQWQSNVFRDSGFSSKCLQFVRSLKDVIFPSLVTQCVGSSSPGTTSAQMIFSHLLVSFCDTVKMFTSCSDEALNKEGESLMKYLTGQFLSEVTNLLCSSPPSLFLLWGYRCLLETVISPFEEILTGDESQRGLLISLLSMKEQEGLLLALSYSLMNPSYWIRRTTLQILYYFPPPAVIQNKSLNSSNENGHERDLDDEVDTSERIVYDVIKLCYEAACLPACFRNERDFSRRLAHLEVFINSSKLPIEFARIISSFCLGMLFVKFQPLWTAAVKVLISAVGNDESETVTWPLVLHVLNYLGHKDGTEVTLSSDQMSDDPLSCLEIINSGEVSTPMNLATSVYFLYSVSRSDDHGVVQPDARTDVHTSYDTVWDVFQKCPSITLRHSKVVVPMFINFLKDQYYHKFSDDSELPNIYFSGLFNLPESMKSISSLKDHDSDSDTVPDLPVSVTKKRLILFLKVFAAVISPKQLFHHQALYKFYSIIVSKPDTTVAKLALDCLLTYKNEAIVPYQQTLKNFFDDGALRNELLGFDPSLMTMTTSLLSLSRSSDEEQKKIEPNHRSTIIPLMIRILYGRFVSKPKGGKSAREQGLARYGCLMSSSSSRCSNPYHCS
jgi:hypothetical protein